METTVENRSLKTNPEGYVLKLRGNKKKIVKSRIRYGDNTEIKSSDYASPITESVARVLINNYRMAVENTHGVIFGIDDLVSISKQKGCTSISFYFALRRAKDFENENIEPGLTLVAIGRRDDESDIMTSPVPRIDTDIVGSGDINDFPEDKEEPTQVGIIMEMVPPIKWNLNYLIKLFGKKFVYKMVKDFLNYNDKFVMDYLNNK